MNLISTLNGQSTVTKETIAEEINTILERCDRIAMSEYRDEKEAAISHNTTCPSCRKSSNVVDKIRNVQGVANIVKEFWGTDEINFKILTQEVNHCNDCGHEWKKFKTRYVTGTEIVRVAFRYLVANFNAENSIHPDSMRYQVLMVFNDMHAETIYKLYKGHVKFLKSDVKSKINLSVLRKHYTSI